MKRPFSELKTVFTCLYMMLASFAFSQSGAGTEYVCLPCGSNCDKELYHEPGTCSHCGMRLVKKTDVTFKSIAPADLCQYIAQHPNIVLLDVRTQREFDQKAIPDYGCLKNAINIPIKEVSSRIQELARYKNEHIIVYCSHSQRSPQVAHLLTENGFTKVFNMTGGLSELDDKSCKK